MLEELLRPGVPAESAHVGEVGSLLEAAEGVGEAARGLKGQRRIKEMSSGKKSSEKELGESTMT